MYRNADVKGKRMSEWYYAKNDRQIGPVTTVSIRQLLASGSLRPTELVWRQGMREWAPVRSVAELAGDAVLEAMPVDDDFVPPAQGAASHLGYFNAREVLGDRARETLKGFPPPVGPQDEWPLGPRQLDQLAEAVKHRKTIRTCANFFQSLCALYVIGAVICLLVTALPGPRGVAGRATDVSVLAGCGVLIGLAVLAFVARGAVLRCRLWAPITFLVVFGAGLVVNVVAIAMNDFAYGSFNSRNGGIEPMVGMITMAAVTALFAWPCIRALSAIPRFRAMPLWAQEAVVHAKL